MKPRTILLFLGTAIAVYFVWKMTRGTASTTAVAATSRTSGLGGPIPLPPVGIGSELGPPIEEVWHPAVDPVRQPTGLLLQEYDATEHPPLVGDMLAESFPPDPNPANSYAGPAPGLKGPLEFQ